MLSEIFNIRHLVATDGAAEGEFIAVGWMLDFEGAELLALALGQLTYLFATYVVTGALFFVTRLAEVRVAPAEPLRDRAAELALELDEVRSVLLAVCRPEPELLSRALAADQVLGLELLLLLLRRDAVLHAAEVRTLALEALVVGQFEDGPSLQVVVVCVVGVPQSRVLVDAFVLGALQRHRVHLRLHLEQLLQLGVQLSVVGLDVELLLAR